jgi:murein DD-endopeptidase
MDNRQTKNFLGWFVTILPLMILLSACASSPVKPGTETGYTPVMGEIAVKTALSMIGRPYKYKGDSPEGFDCSGLVQYSYLTAGLEVPHGTRNLTTISRPVGNNLLNKGDLLFFNERGKKYSHVGIYIGGDEFVHAPSSSKKVRKDSLKDSHWKKTFLEARRFN